MGLRVPKGSAIRVGDSTQRWEEGKALVFDDSFEHEAWNDGPGPRVVLVMDIWHPDLDTPAKRAKARQAS
jgi:aspartyl/asparaginyl beta-hydroxylase (cupin superfamily)